MRVLVIGGTVFLGRAVVEAALARGDEVTYFHRGRHGRGLHPGAEEVLGDRATDLGRLPAREWDAVVDTCGFDPETVGLAARTLADRAGHYAFISSASVYRDWPAAPVDEESPVFESDEPEYGPLKAAAERAAEAAMPGRMLRVRAGVIVGPHENIGRLPHWLRRMRDGGEVEAPEPRDAPIQLIDARDLARWVLLMGERREGGVFNAVAPPGWATWGELLELCRSTVNPGTRLHWVDGERVATPSAHLGLAARLTSRAPSERGSQDSDAGLDDRLTLIEAGPGLGTELRGESVDRAQDGNGGRDCDERDHATIVGACALKL